MEYGDDERSPRPYFYLSYAPVPKPVAPRSGDPNQWVEQLFRDLCEAILQFTNLPAGSAVGFMEWGERHGTRWAERVSHELAACRVFVPLYSPRYFASDLCGREWYAFSSGRPSGKRHGAGQATGIVPVLWVPTKDDTLPPVAGQLQVSHDSLGRDYASEGLYALMRIGSFRSEYEATVHRLARRIVEVAEETAGPVGRPLDLDAQPSAFGPAYIPQEPARTPDPELLQRVSEAAARIREHSSQEIGHAAELVNGAIAEVFLRIGPPPTPAGTGPESDPGPGGTDVDSESRTGVGVGGGRGRA